MRLSSRLLARAQRESLVILLPESRCVSRPYRPPPGSRRVMPKTKHRGPDRTWPCSRASGAAKHLPSYHSGKRSLSPHSTNRREAISLRRGIIVLLRPHAASAPQHTNEHAHKTQQLA